MVQYHPVHNQLCFVTVMLGLLQSNQVMVMSRALGMVTRGLMNISQGGMINNKVDMINNKVGMINRKRVDMISTHSSNLLGMSHYLGDMINSSSKVVMNFISNQEDMINNHPSFLVSCLISKLLSNQKLQLSLTQQK